MNTIWSDFARMIFNVEVEVEASGEPGAGRPGPAEREQLDSVGGSVTYSGGSVDSDRARRAGRQRAAPPRSASRKRRAARGRRRCPSSSAASTRSTRSAATTRAGAARGKKFKKCHGV